MPTAPAYSETRTFDSPVDRVAAAVREWVDDIRERYAFAARLQPGARTAVPFEVTERPDGFTVRLTVAGIASTTTAVRWADAGNGRTALTVEHGFATGALADRLVPGGAFGPGMSRSAVRDVFAAIGGRLAGQGVGL